MTTLNLRLVSSSSTPSGPRNPPSAAALRPWQFDYAPSSDGQDRNLLILFHGLGDSKTGFFELGKSFKLPSTAILSLQAPLAVPLMDHPSFSWYNTFTPLFEPLPNPDPSPTVSLLRDLLSALCSPAGGGWTIEDIHLFGWGQGGTMALELALAVGKDGIQLGSSSGAGSQNSTATSSSSSSSPPRRFGSVVSICAPLLSHPSTPLSLATPVCYFTRKPSGSQSFSTSSSSGESLLRRAFREVIVVRAEGGDGGASGEAMPRGKEWEGVVKFWAGLLNRPDEGWKGKGEVYEVVP